MDWRFRHMSVQLSRGWRPERFPGMSTETRTALDVGGESVSWAAGAVAGLVAGVPFGLMIQFGLGVMPAIGALYGAPGVVIGWVAHLGHSVLFGLVYAGLVTLEPLASYAERWTTGWALGAAYGAALWFVFIGFVWPVWLGAVGFPAAASMSVPFLKLQPLVGHLVYGVVLGIGIPILDRV